jgi:hypothetical protein
MPVKRPFMDAKLRPHLDQHWHYIMNNCQTQNCTVNSFQWRYSWRIYLRRFIHPIKWTEECSQSTIFKWINAVMFIHKLEHFKRMNCFQNNWVTELWLYNNCTLPLSKYQYEFVWGEICTELILPGHNQAKNKEFLLFFTFSFRYGRETRQKVINDKQWFILCTLCRNEISKEFFLHRVNVKLENCKWN